MTNVFSATDADDRHVHCWQNSNARNDDSREWRKHRFVLLCFAILAYYWIMWTKGQPSEKHFVARNVQIELCIHPEVRPAHSWRQRLWRDVGTSPCSWNSRECSLPGATSRHERQRSSYHDTSCLFMSSTAEAGIYITELCSLCH